MNKFDSSLLREKFVISDTLPGDLSDKADVIAMSNRLIIPLHDATGKFIESFVIRAHNMHICLRMGAKIVQNFNDSGSILSREKGSFDWDSAYRAISDGFEDKWNQDHWVAVYHNGHTIYEGGRGERHAFLDIIEQCDARNKGHYEHSLVVAEEAFKKAGKTVFIEHNASMAAVIELSDGTGKCGIILRGPQKTTTFNFKALSNNSDRELKASHLLSVCAAFLEGIQLAFFIGMTNVKIHYEIIDKHSDEARHRNQSGKKLGTIGSAITRFEKLFDVSYRPERPNLPAMIDEAEEYAQKALSTGINKQIAEGDETKWIV